MYGEQMDPDEMRRQDQKRWREEEEKHRRNVDYPYESKSGNYSSSGSSGSELEGCLAAGLGAGCLADGCVNVIVFLTLASSVIYGIILAVQFLLM